MPMDFPDLKSLQSAARIHKFRDVLKGETEHDYRNALADHVASIDFVESEEIRNSVGWDKFTKSQNNAMLLRSILKNKS